MEVQRLEDLKSLDRSLKNIESGVTLLDTHFAKGSDVVPFLDTIEKLAPKVGVTAEVNSVNNVANGAELVVELESRGSFAGVYKFLTLLENSPYQLEFLSMDLRKVTEGDDLSSVEWQGVFRIRLLGFIQ